MHHVHGAQHNTNWTVTQESQLPAKEEMKIGQVLPHASKVMKHENMPTALEVSRKSDCGQRRQSLKCACVLLVILSSDMRTS